MNENIRIVSIDPGAEAGISCHDIDVDNKTMITRDIYFVDLNRIVKHQYTDIVEEQGEPLARVIAFGDILTKYLNSWNPDFVIAEAAYCNPRRVNAYKNLVEYLLSASMAVMNYDSEMVLERIDPSSVKKVVGITKISRDKPAVERHIKLLKDLDLSEIDISTFNQHTVDSIAIGYYLFKELLKGK